MGSHAGVLHADQPVLLEFGHALAGLRLAAFGAVLLDIAPERFVRLKQLGRSVPNLRMAALLGRSGSRDAISCSNSPASRPSSTINIRRTSSSLDTREGSVRARGRGVVIVLKRSSSSREVNVPRQQTGGGAREVWERGAFSTSRSSHKTTTPPQQVLVGLD